MTTAATEKTIAGASSGSQRTLSPETGAKSRPDSDPSMSPFDVLLYPSHNAFSDPKDQPLEIADDTHPGNARFLVLLDLYRYQYEKASSAKDDAEVKEICSDVLEQVVQWTVPSGAIKEWIVSETGRDIEDVGGLGDMGPASSENGEWVDLGTGSEARMVVLRGLRHKPDFGVPLKRCARAVLRGSFRCGVDEMTKSAEVEMRRRKRNLLREQFEKRVKKPSGPLRRWTSKSKSRKGTNMSSTKRLHMQSATSSASIEQYARSHRRLDMNGPAGEDASTQTPVSTKPSRNDIVLIKGESNARRLSETDDDKQNTSNRRLTALVDMYKESFDSSKDDLEKQRSLVAEVTATVYRGGDAPGMFLEKDAANGTYSEASLEIAMSFVEHLLASANPELNDSARSVDKFPTGVSRTNVNKPDIAPKKGKAFFKAKVKAMMAAQAYVKQSIFACVDLGEFDVLIYQSHDLFNEPEDQAIEIANEDHPGNVRFLNLLALYRSKYDNAVKTEDEVEIERICSDIVDKVLGKKADGGYLGYFREWVVPEQSENDDAMGELGDAGDSYGKDAGWVDLGSGSKARLVVLRGLRNEPEYGELDREYFVPK